MAVKKQIEKAISSMDYYAVSNDDLKDFMNDSILQKEKEDLLQLKLEEEDEKIHQLNKNIFNLNSSNNNLEVKAIQARNSTAFTSTEISSIKLDLEKVQAESKLRKVRRLKTNILINAKILKNQEETIQKLQERRESIGKVQELQRNKLIEKREKIEKIKNEAIKNEFNNLDVEFIDMVESKMKNNLEKNQIATVDDETVGNATPEEIERIETFDALDSARKGNSVEILKTQMLNLNHMGEGSMGEVTDRKYKKKIWKSRKSR